MPVSVELGELLRRAIEARLVDVHTSMPARVLSYDALMQKVDVQPLLQRALPGVNGAPAIESLPALTGVPVMFPRGGGGFLKFKLQQGDFVTLLISERSLDQWQATGEISDPADRRLHGLSGARAYPGGYPDPSALDEPEDGDVVVGREGGVQTHWVDDEVRITSATDTDFVALATKVDAMFAALYAAVAGTTIVPGDGGAALKTAIGVAGAAYLSVAAAKAKAT